MKLQYKVLIGAAVVAGAFAAGRFSSPVEVREVEKIKVVQVEKKVEAAKEKRDVVTVVVAKPDGTTTTTTTDKTTVDTAATTDTSTVAAGEKSKVSTYKRPDWSVTAFAGTDFQGVKRSGYSLSGPVVFGAEVQRRVLGPFHVSGLVMSNGTLGVGLGITF